MVMLDAALAVLNSRAVSEAQESATSNLILSLRSGFLRRRAEQ